MTASPGIEPEKRKDTIIQRPEESKKKERDTGGKHVSCFAKKSKHPSSSRPLPEKKGAKRRMDKGDWKKKKKKKQKRPSPP